MMARDPEERPGDAAAVVSAIDALGDLGALPGGAAPAVDPRHRPATASGEAKTSPTLSEQRLVSVVLAGDVEDDELGMARPERAELRAVIEPHGGTLHVLAGGALVVTLWGIGSALDRAAAAARCALGLKARFASLPVCVVTGRGVVSARVVDGELIERAVRTLRSSRSGAVHVDDPTAGLLRDRFRVEADVAAGRAASPHVIRGERTAAEGVPLLLGQATPCVGRMRELSILEGVFAGCVSEPVASAVLVVGEPGSGKSRLRREFLEAVRRRGDRVEVLSGAGEAVGAGSPYRMIADALRRAAGIRDDDPIDARRNKLRARVARRVDRVSRGRVAAFLGELAGAPFPDEDDDALRAARDNARLMSDGIRAAWEDWLAAECAAQPMLLVLEDLHWGDAATVALLDGALRNLRELPLMVLVTARPEVHAAFPSLWSERELQIIRIGPLSRKASEQLVRAALGEVADADLVTRLCDRGQGNPFYLEELVRATHAGRFPESGALPDSVLGTVEARLDAEGAEAKRVLRAASIYGERFSRAGVLALLGGEGADHDGGDVAACLDTLVSREILAPASTPAPTGDPCYVFCHGLLREAAYATLTAPDRALGHRLAGACLEERGATDAMTLAEHFRLGDDAERSAHWCRRAAEHALEANDLTAAVERAARGVASGAAGAERGLLRLVQAEADVWRGELASAEAAGLEAADLLPRGSATWFRALTQAVVAAGKQGGFDRIEARAELVAATPTAPGARSAQIVCLSECATHLLFAGRYVASDALLTRLRRAVPEPATLEAPVAAQLQQIIALRALYSGDPAASLNEFEAALGSFEAAGDRRGASMVRSNLGSIFTELGDFESAEEALRAALAAATRMGLLELATTATANLGHALAYRGQLDEARLLEARAVDAFRALGDPRMEGVSRTYLAKIDLFRGDLEHAEIEARAAADLLKVAPPLRAPALAVLARVLIQQRRAADALPLAHEAHTTLEELGAIEEGVAVVRLVYVEALGATGARRSSERAAREARAKLMERAVKISDPEWRERFLTAVPDNARTLELGGQ